MSCYFVIFFSVKNWCDAQRKARIGIPTYEGSGSHVYQKERFRFLVIPRYGIDVSKVFESRGRKLSTKFVNSLAVQMVSYYENNKLNKSKMI